MFVQLSYIEKTTTNEKKIEINQSSNVLIPPSTPFSGLKPLPSTHEGFVIKNGLWLHEYHNYSVFYNPLYFHKHCTNIHKEKERFPLIDCFDFYSKSVEELKKMPIELKRISKGVHYLVITL